VVAAALVAAWCAVALAGVAVAVSGGGYDPTQQDCPRQADRNNAPKGTTEPGCHAFQLTVGDKQGHRYVEAGIDQLPDGYPSTPGLFGVGFPQSPNFPHSGCVAVNLDGTPGCVSGARGSGLTAIFDTEHLGRNALVRRMGAPNLATAVPSIMGGLTTYMGADDNLDAGEHDGVAGVGADGKPDGSIAAANGPSDGGAVTAHVSPSAASTLPDLTNPLPIAGASEGFCADGYCQEITTRQQDVYHGGGTGSRDVANYGGKKWDPYNCSSGSEKDEATGCRGTGSQPQTMAGWRNAEARNVHAEPGAQVYEDPDPQASPLDPLREAGVTATPTGYPIPAGYIGTCGVVAGGGPAAHAPAGAPSTNSAGQLVLSTGC
jgi:hypothetical protein